MLTVHRLRVNDLVLPLALDDAAPRLTWIAAAPAPRRGAAQTAWHVQVAATPDALAAEGGLLWDSGKVAGADPWAFYAGPALPARATASWRVRVWDEADEASAWSAPSGWETGLGAGSAWDAEWIGAAGDAPRDRPTAPPLLRAAFTVDAPVASARLYVTALGVHRTRLNGGDVADARFLPGWTDYRRRVPYHAFDVASRLREGENVLGATIADGWFAGYLGWGDRRGHYGDAPRYRAQLEMVYADGRRQTVATGPAWRYAAGPVLSADFYHGEAYDARRERPGWDAPGYAEDGAWAPVVTGGGTNAPLEPSPGVPVLAQETFAPVSVKRLPDGQWVFDLGQNMVGVARLRVRAPEGTEITVRTAEMLRPDGTLYREALRKARSTDRYVCRGARGADGRPAVEEWTPSFTFHGFRYVALDGCAEPPGADAVTGVVLGSALPEAGTFSCSADLLNRLQHNIEWGLKGNFLEVPTDCPQRDERLGWTGDIQVFAPTAAYLRDTAAFFRKWLRDLDDSQADDGAYPAVAPNVLPNLPDGGSSWADAGIVVPWVAWMASGDPRFITDRFDGMRRYVRHLETVDHRARHSFGDWLSQNDPTDNELLSLATSARCAGLLARMADAVGRPDDAEALRRARAEFVRRFRDGFLTPSGRLAGDSQTAYTLALAYDLVPEALRPAVAARLVDKVHARRDHLSTGFVGTPWLLPALDGAGETALAYTLLLNETFPSWLYPIAQGGATTMWERWDGWHHERGFQDVGMNSFNHYAYGAVGEWMARRVAGLAWDPAVPGGARFLVCPAPGGGLASARASWMSPRGEAAAAWTRAGATFTLDVTVPVSARARVVLPTARADGIRLDGAPLSPGNGVAAVETEPDGRPAVEIAAGAYTFTCPLA